MADPKKDDEAYDVENAQMREDGSMAVQKPMASMFEQLNPKLKQILDTSDRGINSSIRLMRSQPMLRLGFLVYQLLLHVYLVFSFMLL